MICFIIYFIIAIITMFGNYVLEVIDNDNDWSREEKMEFSIYTGICWFLIIPLFVLHLILSKSFKVLIYTGDKLVILIKRYKNKNRRRKK